MSTQLTNRTQSTISLPRQAISRPSWENDNPFLAGAFAPVHEEIRADNLRVLGRLPPDLDGMFVRNGPNPMCAPSMNYHMFDGDGMLHGVRIRDGRASYLNRYVQTASWREELKTGRCHALGINDGPWSMCKNILRGLRKGNVEFANKANTALIWHHGKLFALWEGGAPYQIDPADLRTIGLETFDRSLKYGFTAHPKVDSVTGEMMFFGYSPLHREVQYGVLDSTGLLTHTTEVSLKRPVMMHDCAITRNNTVFLDLPMTASMLRPLIGQPFYQFRPEHGARFGVLPRHAAGTAIRWFEVEPCFVFHVLNAWETGDWLTVHGCRFAAAPSVLKSKRLANDELTLDAVMYRWQFNLATGEVLEGPIDDNFVEFPRVDDALVGSSTRFGYATSFFSERCSALIKYDLDSEMTCRHELAPGQFAGECVFVPRQDRASEDDGFLVSLIHDEMELKSELVVVDGREFHEAPIARIQMPQRVPAGFHGVWLDGHDL